MAANLVITAIQGPPNKKLLNNEWIELHNTGDAPFNGEGCSISVARGGARPKVITTMKAGLVMQPDERVRLVSGSPGKKSQGEAPEDDQARNFFLFLKAPYLDRPNVTVRLVSGQRELCRTSFPQQ
ncbi:MAG: lamin tail domain-containing protein [Deltaproteobacteria bacterium]|nr:lamin tail domain-containing protein [Deltaproteobacteria bacterium]